MTLEKYSTETARSEKKKANKYNQNTKNKGKSEKTIMTFKQVFL